MKSASIYKENTLQLKPVQIVINGKIYKNYLEFSAPSPGWGKELVYKKDSGAYRKF